MNKDDFNFYVVAELAYKKKYNKGDNIFPFDWYSSQNYKLKTDILAEALKNNIKIADTELYQNEFIEGIKRKKR